VIGRPGLLQPTLQFCIHSVAISADIHAADQPEIEKTPSLVLLYYLIDKHY